MKKIIEINGVNFEYEGTTSRNVVKQRSLYEVYSSPSAIKRQIWYEWIRFFDELKCWEYGISSYNCNFFTIEAIVYDVDGKNYILNITKCHNRCYEIVD